MIDAKFTLNNSAPNVGIAYFPLQYSNPSQQHLGLLSQYNKALMLLNL